METYGIEKSKVEKETKILEIGDEEDVGSEDEKIGICGGEEALLRFGANGDSRKLRGLGDPRKPTQKEVDDHRLTHLPYRN